MFGWLAQSAGWLNQHIPGNINDELKSTELSFKLDFEQFFFIFSLASID